MNLFWSIVIYSQFVAFITVMIYLCNEYWLGKSKMTYGEGGIALILTMIPVLNWFVTIIAILSLRFRTPDSEEDVELGGRLAKFFNRNIGD